MLIGYLTCVPVAAFEQISRSQTAELLWMNSYEFFLVQLNCMVLMCLISENHVYRTSHLFKLQWLSLNQHA